MEACARCNGRVPFGDTWKVSQICVEMEGKVFLTMFDVDWDVESSS